MIGSDERRKAEDRLEELHHRIREDRDCPLLALRTQAVPGEGPANARVIFLGEAPGEKEDETGRPLVGNAGRVFNELLASIGLDREAVYLTGAIKCRPPDNRTPKAPELAHCRGYFWEAVEIIQPQLICPMGSVALKMVMGSKASITRLHGTLVAQGEDLLPPIPSCCLVLPGRVEEHHGEGLCDAGRRSAFKREGVKRGRSTSPAQWSVDIPE